MAKDKEPAAAGQPEEDGVGMSEGEIDRNLIDTFPASDSPSWTLGTDHRDESQNKESRGESEAENSSATTSEPLLTNDKEISQR